MTGDCVPISVDSQRCLVLGWATAAPVHYLRREVSTAATRPFGFFLDSLRPCLAKGLTFSIDRLTFSIALRRASPWGSPKYSTTGLLAGRAACDIGGQQS